MRPSARSELRGICLTLLIIAAVFGGFVLWLSCVCATAETLKQSTATQKVILGPFVTSATGYTISTALTVTVTISKNGASLAARASTVTPVSVGGGYYAVTLDATDTDTAGNLFVAGYASGYLRCSARCDVIAAGAWTPRYTATLQAVNATQVEGADATDTLKAQPWLATTRTITGGTVTTIPNVTLANGAHGGAAATLTLSDYSAFKATGFSTHSAADVWAVTTRTVTGGTITSVPAVTLANGAHGGAAATITLSDYSNFKATGFSTHSAADVWAVTTRTITGGTITSVPAVTLANGAHGGAAATITLSDYSAFKATGFSTLSSADVSAAVWNAATATYGTANSYGALVEYALDTNLASRLADASYTVPPTAGAISTQVAADLAAAHGAGSWLSGAGLDAASIRAALGLAAANLDTQLADLPTVAEFEARTLAAAGYAPAATALSSATWTGTRAAYLDTILKIVQGGR